MPVELAFASHENSVTWPGKDAVSPAGPVAVRVFPGIPEQTPLVRRWTRALLAAGSADLDCAEVIVSEMYSNAVLHTKSGDSGGLVAVAVTASGVIHVHDQGSGEVPPRGLPLAVPGRLREHGRGLVLVTALSQAWGFTPADQCRAGGPGDPAPGAHGGCVWACPQLVRSEPRDAHAPGPAETRSIR